MTRPRLSDPDEEEIKPRVRLEQKPEPLPWAYEDQLKEKLFSHPDYYGEKRRLAREPIKGMDSLRQFCVNPHYQVRAEALAAIVIHAMEMLDSQGKVGKIELQTLVYEDDIQDWVNRMQSDGRAPKKKKVKP